MPATPTAKDIAWTLDLPGKGLAAGRLGGQIFVTAEDAKPGSRFVVCVNAETGKELWRFRDTFEVYPQHALNSYAASTPVADAERVYVSWLTGTNRRVLALDHAGREDLGGDAWILPGAAREQRLTDSDRWPADRAE